jgi:hypothetical protein
MGRSWIMSDTSETYLKMCEAAWPDLKEYDREHGPLFSRRLRMMYGLDGKAVMWAYEVNTSNSDRAYPLWEQDQLQEMICETKDDCYRIFVNGCYQDGNWDRLETMEQLWLAFVMKEKFKKIWKDDKWFAGWGGL